ncbi:capsule biosynthesis GfcC family protein [Paraglaciecola aquimarina]|uniref:Capsule biosynthesis GfcC family protein n=1 Tax=Paraglaciecola algarum TaxID=3050085 RepID=A0ABS9D6A6_9ALTE|nr:capsule biosynthesis GfcC family protein [Paraglaciecola sp. G1-23]MCF2948425.1 capsule biosynthesis GfcC family protein [Paraglaciecola sp. G1-23]
MNLIKMKYIAVITIYLFLVVCTSESAAKTQVQFNQQHFLFESPPLLSEVLAKVPNKSNVYWPAAAMFLKSDLKLETSKAKVLTKLTQLARNKKIADTILRLEQNVNDWQLAKRLPIAVDYDLARTVNKHNPLVNKGDYILQASQRSHFVYIFGAINNDIKQMVPHKSHTPVSDYITKGMLSTEADMDNLVLIQADGRVMHVSTVDWNKARIEIMPGSQIYIPFKTSIWNKQIAWLNQQLVALAVNRVIQ